MDFKRFTLLDGTTDCFVNLDQIVAARPGENGTMILYTAFMSLTVDAGQFEKAIDKSGSSAEAVPGLLVRLTQAVDRLSSRIPSSIRVHM